MKHWNKILDAKFYQIAKDEFRLGQDGPRRSFELLGSIQPRLDSYEEQAQCNLVVHVADTQQALANDRERAEAQLTAAELPYACGWITVLATEDKFHEYEWRDDGTGRRGHVFCVRLQLTQVEFEQTRNMCMDLLAHGLCPGLTIEATDLRSISDSKAWYQQIPISEMNDPEYARGLNATIVTAEFYRTDFRARSQLPLNWVPNPRVVLNAVSGASVSVGIRQINLSLDLPLGFQLITFHGVAFCDPALTEKITLASWGCKIDVKGVPTNVFGDAIGSEGQGKFEFTLESGIVTDGVEEPQLSLELYYDQERFSWLVSTVASLGDDDRLEIVGLLETEGVTDEMLHQTRYFSGKVRNWHMSASKVLAKQLTDPWWLRRRIAEELKK
jgi:hypothetical protein